MKNISLTQNELDVLETALALYGLVVSFDQLAKLFDENRTYTRKRIGKLAKQGWLKRIKKGLYVISDFSSRGSLPISHYVVSNLLVEESYISFESALQYHGLYDQLLTTISSVSLKQYRETKINNVFYRFVKTTQKNFFGWRQEIIDDNVVRMASVEKALLDLLQFHRDNYAVDLALEKLQNDQDEIEIELIISLAQKTNLTTQRILGFLLDLADIDSRQLFQAIGNKPGTSRSSQNAEIYNSKWRLYYNQYFNKYA